MWGEALPDLRGYEARGRHGRLGEVVEANADDEGRSGMVVVRDGASDLLVYYIPESSVRSIHPSTKTILLDVDLADFVPRMQEDGTIRLYASA